MVDYDFGTDCGGGSLTSCRNNPPAVANSRPLKIITSCTFEGLDALSFGCDITVVVVIDSGSAGDHGDQVLCCMLPENKNYLKKTNKHVIVNQERADSDSTSGPSRLCAAQCSQCLT